jgi:NADH-quinone oxidoreductase subunit G
MGLAPGVLPGRVSLEDGHRWFTDAWGAAPEQRGRDAHGILAAAAAGELQALVLLGADPLADFPDRDLARRALEGVPFVLAVGASSTARPGWPPTWCCRPPPSPSGPAPPPTWRGG